MVDIGLIKDSIELLVTMDINYATLIKQDDKFVWKGEKSTDK